MILFFSGRKHHTLKMKQVFDAMGDHDPRWLISNNAINIDSSLQYARGGGDNFIHAYFHLERDDPRKIDGIAGEFMEKVYVPGVSPFWTMYSVREAAEFYVACGNILTDQVKAVVVLHTNNFWTKTLCYLAQKRGIPTFSFQEGLLRDRDQETMNKQLWAAEYVDKVFVWSRGSKRRYIEAGVENNRLVVTGAPHLDAYARMSVEAALEKSTMRRAVLFAPTTQSEYIGNIGEDAQMLRELAIGAGYEFVFRPHPFEAKGYNGELDTFRAPDNLTLCRSGAIVVGQHSTMLYEALALGSLVIEYVFNGVPILHSLADEGVAISASKQDVARVFADLGAAFGKVDVKKINRFVEDEFAAHLGNATANVVREIKKAL
jgi:hypothetical protein